MNAYSFKAFVLPFVLPMSLMLIFGCSLSSEKKDSPNDSQSKKTVSQENRNRESGISESEASQDEALKKLKEEISKLNADSGMHHVTWGFMLSDPITGDVIASHNPDKSLIPASIQKVITTGVTMKAFGAEKQFTTQLCYDGFIDTVNKVLQGNLYIKGGGDPSLGSSVFSSADGLMKAWANAVSAEGIDSIAGYLIADARYFETNPYPQGWAWEDLQSDYGTSISGLSFAENNFRVTPKKKNGESYLRVRPEADGIKLINRISYARRAKNQAFMMPTASPGEYMIYGTLRTGKKTFLLPMPEPEMVCARALKKALGKKKIGVRDGVSTVRKLRLSGNFEVPDSLTIFESTASAKLSDMVKHTNTVSQNFYAETFFRQLAVYDNRHGSTANAADFMREFWEEQGLNLQGYVQTDGSGLSRSNTLTPRQMCGMLNYFASDSLFFKDFLKTLPVAGKDGTMKYVCKKTEAEGRIMAKSGYMSRVRSYAGYVLDKKNRPMSFVIISNHHEYSGGQMRRRFEPIMVAMSLLGG